MDKTAIDILKQEHDKVLSLLNTLEDNLKNKRMQESGENIEFLETEFDEHSLNKEEKILFPEIEKIIPRDGGPTGVMIMEHRDLTASMQNFRNAHKAKRPDEMQKIGTHIISLLRQHIDKENNMLFMMADAHLADEQKKRILEKFNERDAKHKCCEHCQE